MEDNKRGLGEQRGDREMEEAEREVVHWKDG